MDATLATLRMCTSMAELVDRAGELAVEGCSAEAASVGQVTDGVWVPWPRSVLPILLGSGDTVSAGPVQVADARTVERQVISSGQTVVCDQPEATGGGKVVVAAIAAHDAVLGVLHVMGHDLMVEVVESYARALGSMLVLLSLQRRAEEQRYTLARLRHSLAEGGERPVELYDTTRELSGTRPSAAPARPSSSVLRARLTARQREVLDLMMRGLSNAEMAERLVVALPTVKSHVRAVLRASGAVNRSEAVARFLRGEQVERSHRQGSGGTVGR